MKCVVCMCIVFLYVNETSHYVRRDQRGSDSQGAISSPMNIVIERLAEGVSGCNRA